jgi:hypothetical protein
MALLILVGAALDTAKRLEIQMWLRRYEGFSADRLRAVLLAVPGRSG